MKGLIDFIRWILFMPLGLLGGFAILSIYDIRAHFFPWAEATAGYFLCLFSMLAAGIVFTVSLWVAPKITMFSKWIIIGVLCLDPLVILFSIFFRDISPFWLWRVVGVSLTIVWARSNSVADLRRSRLKSSAK